MNDLLFDITTRELVMKNRDFVVTANPSVQNGGILLYSRGANPLSPMWGIGLIPQVIDGPTRDLAVEMNRWKAQAIADGATIAKWSGTPSARSVDLEIDVSYI